MEGSELVLIAWSDPYSSGFYKDKRVPVATLDLDVNVKNAFSGEDVKKAVELGSGGILVASGIVKAKNWDKIIEEFAKAMV